MAELTGSEIIARCLQKEGVKDLFYIMGGPMLLAEATCIKEGIRMIDVRHEQAAAFTCQAYSRLKQVPSVCMAASGPGVTNLITGMANALVDCCPVVAFGGSSPLSQFGRQVFQEIDQVELMRGCCKHVDRLINLKRIPQQINFALQKAITGKPGPVYLDCPGDMLYQKIDENLVDWSFAGRPILDSRPLGDPRQVDALIGGAGRGEEAADRVGLRRDLVARVGGDAGVRRSRRHPVLHHAAGPRRGAGRSSRIPILSMRSGAFREADLIIVLGTRMNYIIGHASPPRFGPSAKIARIDIDPAEIGTAARYVDIPIVGDCKAVLGPVAGRHQGPDRSGQYTPAGARQLKDGEAAKRAAAGANKLPRTATSIPSACWKRCATSCKRDAILCVDGQETLNFGRQTMSTFAPGHRLNSGPFGTMGVGLPFGVGAKVACPDKQVIVVHGDGSMGLNAMELDTAIRHKIPLLVVISLNGGWTGDPKREKPGRDLGYTRYDKICEALGGYGEYITKAEDITPALERAQKKVDEGMVALVNVRTDYRARFSGVAFSDYST